jgi:hypothetical protein
MPQSHTTILKSRNSNSVRLDMVCGVTREGSPRQMDTFYRMHRKVCPLCAGKPLDKEDRIATTDIDCRPR